MSDAKNELNDIILNKNGGDFSGFKKVLLAVATFAVLLIIVVVVMSTLGDDKEGLAKTIDAKKTTKIIPPAPNSTTQDKANLFKPAVISSDDSTQMQAAPLDLEAAPVVEEPQEKEVVETKEPVLPKEKKAEKTTVISDPYDTIETKPITIKPVTTATSNTAVTPKKHYVQVGSFQKFKPSKKLLKKIKANGFSYALKQVKVRGKMVTKLLIGPYNSYREANVAKAKVAAKIEASAFIYKAR